MRKFLILVIGLVFILVFVSLDGETTSRAPMTEQESSKRPTREEIRIRNGAMNVQRILLANQLGSAREFIADRGMDIEHAQLQDDGSIRVESWYRTRLARIGEPNIDYQMLLRYQRDIDTYYLLCFSTSVDDNPRSCW